MGLFDKIFGNYSKKELAKIEPIKNKVLELESKYADMSDEELGGQTAILRGKLDELSTLDDVQSAWQKALPCSDNRCYRSSSGTYRRNENR